MTGDTKPPPAPKWRYFLFCYTGSYAEGVGFDGSIRLAAPGFPSAALVQNRAGYRGARSRVVSITEKSRIKIAARAVCRSSGHARTMRRSDVLPKLAISPLPSIFSVPGTAAG